MVRSAGGELRGAGVDGLVDRPNPQRPADPAHHVLAQVPQARDLSVGEAVPLRRTQQVRGQLRRGLDQGCDLQDQHELIDKPRIDLGRLVDLIRGGTRAKRLHDHIEPAIVWASGTLQQLLNRIGDLGSRSRTVPSDPPDCAAPCPVPR